MCGAGCGARAAVALHHVNLLLVVFAGACLATGARLRWDPSLYVAARELLPAEYRVLAAAVPGAGAALLALAHLAAAAAAPRRRPTLLYTYAALMAAAVAAEAAVLGWAAARLAQVARSPAAAELRELLATRDHLRPLLRHLARWHPLPDHLADLVQEAVDDLPWNGYVAAAALAALALLQLLGAALALLAACSARSPRSKHARAVARSRTPLSASRVSLVDSFRYGAAQHCRLVIVWLSVDRSGASSARTPPSPASLRAGDYAPLRTKYKNGRIVPL